MMTKNDHMTAQATGALVELKNEARFAELEAELSRMSAEQVRALGLQNEAFRDAILEIKKLRDFIGSPERILGNAATKHGEVAEQVDVSIRNAESLISEFKKVATFDGVGRTADLDYILNNTDIQSKFINGEQNTLMHVLEHMHKYHRFQGDSSDYIIPKDQHERIMEILTGSVPEGWRERTAIRVFEKVKEIEHLTGGNFSAKVKPSISDYKDVQQGVIHKTVEGHESRLTELNEAKVSDLNEDYMAQKQFCG